MNNLIDRRGFLKAAGVGLAAATLNGCGRVFSDKQNNKHPNLVFVFPDQMRAHAMGFMNEDPVITPRLDAFSKESLVLTQMASNYPVCSPFRAMFMTGRYPHANKVIENCNSNSAPYNCQLQESDRCWSEVLKDKGYSLGYIGKWHLDSPHKPYVKCHNNSEDFAWNEWCPPARRHGFDFWYAYGTYDYHNRPMYWTTDADRDSHHFVDQWGPEHEADLAIKYIRNENEQYRKKDKPFALVVSMNPPHMPYKMVPQKYVNMYADKDVEALCNRDNIPPADTKWGKYYRNNIKYYLAMVTGVDEQFGRILDALKVHGLDKDTIIVFSSDHGNCLGIHDAISKNNRYEESMRIPFLIRWSGKIKARKDTLLMSVPDIYPTLLNLIGFGSDVPKDVQGESFAKLFLTGKGKRPGSQMYIWVKLKNPAIGRRGIRTDRYTFVTERKKDQEDKYYLHDNVEDKYQLKNIAADNPGLVSRLKTEMENWLKKTGDPWVRG